MPLIKNLEVDPDLCGETFRRREWALQKDYIRRMELGKEVSIRAVTIKGAMIIKALREVSEEDVVINDAVLEVYADAEDWLCRKMNTLFQTVRHLGMNPVTMKRPIAAMYEYGGITDPLVGNGCDFVWIPTCAFVIGDERVYLFRVAGKQLKSINQSNSGVIGYTREYLNTATPEVAAYIAKLESKAMDDEEVRNAFTRLGSVLRPKAYKDEMLAERAKQYENAKTDFGGWA
ncbi:hypothetical protein phiK7B1_071 [Pseudomonas phage phiK7B1]|nr:hypothetical protein phiK7B1_071 [Pseudomonas phage phiK7B1]